MVFEAGPDSLPISAILPSLTPTSPRKAGIPEPSTTRPFLISRSYAIGFLLQGRAAAAGPPPVGVAVPRRRALSPHGWGPSHAIAGGMAGKDPFIARVRS